MIQTSELYKQLFNSGAIQEYKVVIDGVEYLGDSIYDTPTITQNLFDKPTLTVGSFTIAELNIKLKVPSSDINSNSSIEFYYRYTNGDDNSEWIKKFNGYINSREQVDNEVTTVQAKSKAYNYDLFLDHIEVDAYPANARTVAQKCATHLGLTLDADVINENIVEFPNELTVVQVLQLIGKSSGGNWYITPDDKLKLIKFDEQLVLETFAAQSYESSQPVSPINKVTAYYDDESAFTAGVDGSSELKIDNRWATQSSTNYVLSQIDGYEYLPAKGFNVYLDPAYELGDYFEYEDGTEQLIANLTWTFGGITTANVESPISSENNFDDPRQNLINQQFKRKVSLGDNYQGVSIGREDGIVMLLSPNGKEEEAIARWYSDLTKGQAFQTRATPNDEWVDWMYFDINEKIYKLSLYSTTDDVDAKIQFSIEQVHMGNLILNFNGQDEYSGVTGYSNLLTSDELTSSDFLTNMMPAMPIEILGSKSRYGWRFNNSGYLEWDRVYKSESGIHSFKGRFDGDMDVEVKITEYENYDDVTALKETVKTLTSEEYREFSIELDDDTNFFNLAMNVPSASPTNYLYASELMLTYGDPKDYYEGAADAFAYARATRTMLGSKITDAVTEIDRLTGDIHNTTVDITARDGVVIKNNNGKGLTVLDDNNEPSIELTSAGKLKARDVEVTGTLLAGDIANLQYDGTGITFPDGQLKLDSANNSINFGNMRMKYNERLDGDVTIDEIVIQTNNGEITFDSTRLDVGGYVPDQLIVEAVVSSFILAGSNVMNIGDYTGNWDGTVFLGGKKVVPVRGDASLGDANNRFNQIFSKTALNVSSDTRHKFAIQDIPQGLLDEISRVEAKMYLQGDRWNFGYMAQDIERALYLWATRKYGLDAKYYVDKFSILHKSESYLSLLYGEISVMKIKSLEARLEKLENERK